MKIYQIVILILASLVLIAISWHSLRRVNHHGFYRFFAWELIILQVTLQVPLWFLTPLRWNQLISWTLLLASLYLVMAGYYSLSRFGGERKREFQNPNFPFENTSQLVTTGIYTYIRHPLYSSLLFGAWGVFFKSFSRTGGLLVLLSSGFIYLTAKVEEKENIESFGPQYREYMIKSKMFIPFVW